MMLNRERKEVKALVISILVVSFAFSLQKLSFLFMIKSLLVVSLSIFLGISTQVIISKNEGIDTKYEIWAPGLIFTGISAVLSGGLAVFAAPFTSKSKERETERWMKSQSEMFTRETALGPVSRLLVHLSLATIFLILLESLGNMVFNLGALVNFWLVISQLVPYPPFEGRKIIVWDVIFWAIFLLTALVGLIGLFI